MFDLKAFREQKLPTQDEIILQWGSYKLDKPIVSIVCTTFNQENYIEDALKGFLIQKTSFPFEIIIHDDASSDNTVGIIKRYEDKYPLIIKTILQKENQYSKSPNSVLLITFEAVASEFIALCEGDDFWVCENKLQEQYSALLAHPEINICFSSAFGLKNDGAKKVIANYGTEEKIINLSQVIRGGGGFMPTASIFLRRDAMLDLPAWFRDAPVGDYYIQILASKYGALYIPSRGVFYRLMALGSWSATRALQSKERIIAEILAHEEILNKIEMKDSDRKYALAGITSNVAFTLLKNKLREDSMIYIKKSWGLYPKANNLQRLLYRTRYCMGLYLKIVYIYELIKRKN